MAASSGCGRRCRRGGGSGHGRGVVVRSTESSGAIEGSG